MSDFSNLFQNTLKFGVMALRENAIMPRLVSQDFGPEEASKGDTININIPRPKTAGAVTPGTPDTAEVRDHTKHPIVMDQWRETSFNISDKEEREVFEQGILPMDASEAIKALMNELDLYILNKLILKVPYRTNGASTMSDVTEVIAMRTAMVNQLAPMDNMNMVMSPTVEGALLALPVFHAADQSGGLQGLVEGNLGKKFGLQMFMDQNMAAINTHTNGNAVGSILTMGVPAIGDTAIVIDGGSTDTFNDGDIVVFGGDPNTYIILSSTGDTSAGTLTIFPALKVAIGDGATVGHAVGSNADDTHVFEAIALHPQCFGLVNRPLRRARDGLGVVSESVTDPITGISLRLEVTRTGHQDLWNWDLLYGGDVVRPEYAIWHNNVTGV